MVKNWSSAGILVAALFACAIIFQQTQFASAKSFNDDPVPGGMCGCMSCNCYIEDGAIADKETSASDEVGSQVASVYSGSKLAALPPEDQAAIKASTKTVNSSGSPDDRQEKNDAAKTTTTATKTTTASPAKTTTTATAATKTTSAAATTKTTTTATKTTTATPNSSGSPDDRDSGSSASSGSSGGSSSKTTTAAKPANPNTSTPAKNSSGSPDDRQEKNDAAKSAVTNNATKATGTAVKPSTVAPNSSGSPDDRQEKNDAAKKATGKSNNSYWYSSDITNTSPDLTAPRIDRSSYSPQTATPGKNNTLTPTTPTKTSPGTAVEVQYSYGQAVLEARKNTNDTGAKYEYRTPSGEVRYVDSNGRPLLSAEPVAPKTSTPAPSASAADKKIFIRKYETPEEAKREAKAFKNDDNTYYGFPADPTDKNNKRFHYFDSNGDYVLEI